MSNLPWPDTHEMTADGFVIPKATNPLQTVRDYAATLVAIETRRMERHQSAKLQSDLKAYLKGFEICADEIIARCDQLIADQRYE